ncbi:ATP-dependent DNA helicase [Frankliniella fusca]|uniref:ATP-dependent DNA helicase n=1 Tax=Frankliniella fusca TaxID=407009 RepID=A0AAE1H0E5_9NEOP|nr:ATP-dependent DNA helicase [Frankliniella fusca]
MRVLSGTFDQSDCVRFPRYGGRQCSANAVAALCKAHVLNPNLWTSLNVDECLMAGNKLFEHSYEILPTSYSNIIYLRPDELYSCVMFPENEIKFQADVNNEYYGTSMNNIATVNFGMVNYCIDDAVLCFLHNFNYGVFTCKLQCVAIMKIVDEYFLFDSHKRGKNGLTDGQNGTAVLMSFTNINNLVLHLKNLFKCTSCLPTNNTVQCASCQFTIIPIFVGNVTNVSTNAQIDCCPSKNDSTKRVSQLELARNAKKNKSNAKKLKKNNLQSNIQKQKVESETIPASTTDLVNKIYDLRIQSSEPKYERTEEMKVKNVLQMSNRYKTNVEVRESKISQNREKYQTDEVFREVHSSKMRKKMREKYQIDKDYHNKVLENAKTSYHTPQGAKRKSNYQHMYHSSKKTKICLHERFNEQKKEMPTIICTCCAQLFFKKSTVSELSLKIDHTLKQADEIDDLTDQQETLLTSGFVADSGVKIAPGEGNMPLSLTLDEDMDVLAFPTVYGGKQRIFKVKYTPVEMAKAEARHHDRRVATNIPKNRVTVQRCTRTCKKNAKGNTSCRFNYPLPPMRKNKILLPLSNDMDEQEKLTARKLWSEIKEQTEIIARNHEDCSFDEYLAYLNVDEQSYIQALRSKLKRPTVFLGRNLNERRVNAYNREMLILWEAHMDIQLVVSPYGCVKYIVSYVSKSQKGMSKLLKEVADRVAKGDEPTIKKLRKIVNAFLNNCEISAQEIALHVLGIPMSKSSIGTIYINSCPPDQRVFLKKGKKELEKICETDPDSTDIQETGMIEHYIDRPDILESTCLADFAALYKYSKTHPHKKNVSTDEIEIDLEINDDEIIAEKNCDDESNKKTVYELKNNSGFLTKRNKRLVIQFRNYKEGEDKLNFQRENLMLFTSWRTEPSLLDSDLPMKFGEKLEVIQTNRSNYCKYDSVFDNIEVDLLEEDEENEEESTVAPQFKILDLNETPSDFQLEIPHTEKIISTAESMRFPLPNILPENKVTTLYYCNADVDAFNNLFLAVSPNEKIVSRALDSCSGTKSRATITYMLSQAQKLQHKKTQNMQYLLKLCVETKYIVSHNIAVPDGISNGSPCILKKVIYGQLCEKNSRERIPIRAYVQFEKESTGEKTRQRLQNIIKADGITEKNWTPIQRICRSFSLNENTHIQVTRNQLPLLPSNAQTIHCSQSCTYDNILVFLNKTLSRKLLYTACSRVTSLSGLYLSGIYKKPARATLENDPSLREMTRMRNEAQLQFSLIFPEDVKNKDNTVVLFHNVRSLNLHFENISCDPTFIASDIIMLAETWSKPEDKYDINNFTIISRTDCKSPKRKAFGTLVYVKNYLLPHVNILFQNESISGTNHSTVVALTMFSKTVIMVYKSPKTAWNVLKQQLQQAITKSLENHIYDITIMGDFNIKYQVSDPNYTNLKSFMTEANCSMLLDATKVSTDHSSLIDLCFSTNTLNNADIFESVTSDHKPIWIELAINHKLSKPQYFKDTRHFNLRHFTSRN